VKRKLLASALLGLFAWNTVFGAVGGLLLCLHQSLTLHPELISGKISDCAPETTNRSTDGSTELTCLSDAESCVDVELEAVDLSQVRIDEVQSMPGFSALHRATPKILEPNFTLREIAHIVQAQAPPELLDTSVLVAQATNLRL